MARILSCFSFSMIPTASSMDLLASVRFALSGANSKSFLKRMYTAFSLLLTTASRFSESKYVCISLAISAISLADAWYCCCVCCSGASASSGAWAPSPTTGYFKSEGTSSISVFASIPSCLCMADATSSSLVRFTFEILYNNTKKVRTRVIISA